MKHSSSTEKLKDYIVDVKPSIEKAWQGQKDLLGGTGRSVAQRLFDEKEVHRQIYRDEVYSLEDWRKAKAWHRHLPSFNSVTILRGYIWIVIFHTAVAMLICSYHYWLEPLGAPGWADNDSDVWQVFNLTSFALALLLVFRTNSSYNRWWEARILWGSQINMTRNIVRTAISWFPKDEEKLLGMFARWSIVMSFALKGALRGENLTPELQRQLPRNELCWASESSHLPSTVAQVLSNILVAVDLPEFQRVMLDRDILRYTDILGSCERIVKTPIHRNWTSHTVRFTIIWLLALPFALWPVYGWATPALEFVLSFLMLGIENIGVQIEEPFAVLALDAYCGVCERGVQLLMSQRHGSTQLVRDVQRGGLISSRAFSLGGHDGGRLFENSSLHSGNAHSNATADPNAPAPPRGSIEL